MGYISKKWKLRFGKRKFTGNRGVKEKEMIVAVTEGKSGFVERYHTEKELREAVIPLLDERVISVDITKRAL